MLLRLTFIVAFFLAAVSLAAVTLQLTGILSPPRTYAVEEVPSRPPAQTELLVAARRLARGTLLRPEDIVTRRVAISDLPEGSIPASDDARASLAGALLRNPIEPRMPVLRDDLIHPRDRGFLAAVLRPGSRAISVSVDLTSGAAGLIWPGDRVDLILTQQNNEASVPTSRRTWGETVLTNVTVIAVDQRLSQGGHGEGVDADQRRNARTVTLEVTPEQAEQVAVATRLGRLSLVVRSAEDAVIPVNGQAIAPRQRTMFGSDVSPALAVDPERLMRLRIIQGADSTEVTFR